MLHASFLCVGRSRNRPRHGLRSALVSAMLTGERVCTASTSPPLGPRYADVVSAPYVASRPWHARISAYALLGEPDTWSLPRCWLLMTPPAPSWVAGALRHRMS